MANHRWLELKDLSVQPESLGLGPEVVDGGLRLGSSPGHGVRVDQAAIEALMQQPHNQAGAKQRMGA